MRNLTARAQSMLGASPSERIKSCLEDRWFQCPRFNRVIDAVFNVVHARNVVPAPCLLICAEGGYGKSSLIERLRFVSAGWDRKLAFMSISDNPDDLKFKHLVFQALGIPQLSGLNSRRGTDAPYELLQLLELRKIGGLSIDEMHDALSGVRNEQVKNLIFMKALSGDPCRISVIAFGTEVAKIALSYDPQLKRRYEVIELQRWSYDEEYLNFLASWEGVLPLRNSSDLHQEKIARMILIESDGVLDQIVKIIKWAAVQAILGGEERITEETIRRGFKVRWGFSVEHEVKANES